MVRIMTVPTWVLLLLAHLSRRLIGELLVFRGIRRPSVVRPSSTFSNDFFSEAASWADSSHISYIASIGRGNE